MNRVHFFVFLITFLFVSYDEVNRLIKDIHLLKKES